MIEVGARTRDARRMLIRVLPVLLLAACSRTDTSALEARVAKLEERLAAQAAANAAPAPSPEANWYCNELHCFRAKPECDAINRALVSQKVAIKPCEPARRAYCVQMAAGGAPLCTVTLASCRKVEPEISGEPKYGTCIGVE